MRLNSARPVSVSLTTFIRLSRGDMRRLTIFDVRVGQYIRHIGCIEAHGARQHDLFSGPICSSAVRMLYCTGVNAFGRASSMKSDVIWCNRGSESRGAPATACRANRLRATRYRGFV